MPNIIDKTYFQKANGLYIPLSVSAPVSNVSSQSPSNVAYLDNLCVKVEKSILLNALGLEVYNTLQLALADLNNPLYASYKKLVEGDEYDGKVWNGLDNDYSLIAYRILEIFLTETNERLSAVGVTQVSPQNATLFSPNYKIAIASQNFINQYQKGYLNEPLIYNGGEFIDWFGLGNDLEVSLYEYLFDKQADFEGLDVTKFKVYKEQNSYGI